MAASQKQLSGENSFAGRRNPSHNRPQLLTPCSGTSAGHPVGAPDSASRRAALAVGSVETQLRGLGIPQSPPERSVLCSGILSRFSSAQAAAWAFNGLFTL